MNDENGERTTDRLRDSGASIPRHGGSGNGLTFNAAVPGDEAAYQALHYALSTFDSGISQMASK